MKLKNVALLLLLSFGVSSGLKAMERPKTFNSYLSPVLNYEGCEVSDPEHDSYIAKLLAEHNKQHAFSSANQNEVSIINVGVILHQEWLDQMAVTATFNDTGKPYENGAQFAVKRIFSQYKILNESLKAQGINLYYEPTFFTIVNHDLSHDTSSDSGDDFRLVRDCVYNYIEGRDDVIEKCNATNLEHARLINYSKMNILHYVKNREHYHYTLGLGSFPSMLSIHDDYHSWVNSAGHYNDGGEWTEQMLESFRFGANNAQVFIHEIGHTLGGRHQVNPAEPIDGYDNRAYACGQQEAFDPTYARFVNTSLKRGTAISTGNYNIFAMRHTFFSDPDTFVDGERCGELGEANNKANVLKNVAFVASIGNLPNKVSDLYFVNNEISFNRSEGYGEIVIRRHGDINEPAFLNLIATDDTAWEKRDFDFGLKVVEFKSGETEKNVRFDIVERNSTHPNTSFTVKMLRALHANIDESEIKINILSDNPLSGGEIGFRESEVLVTEGEAIHLEVTRLNGSDGDVTFNVATVNGSALHGVDYKALNQSFTIQSGNESAVVLIETIERSEKQGERDFLVIISDVEGASLVSSQAVVSIKDKLHFGSIGFEQTTSIADEDGSVTLNIIRTDGSDGDVSVSINTQNGTAIAGRDFVGVNEVINFTEGQTIATVVVNMINREGIQGDRNFSLRLASPTGGASLGSNISNRVTIKDVIDVIDEPKPSVFNFQVSNISVNENDVVTLNIVRTIGDDQETSVTVRTVNGTAFDGVDFRGVNQVVKFNRGQTSASLSLNMINREGIQGSRYFNVQLESPEGSDLIGATSSVRITVNDVITNAKPEEQPKSSGGTSSVWFLVSLILCLFLRGEQVIIPKNN